MLLCTPSDGLLGYLGYLGSADGITILTKAPPPSAPLTIQAPPPEPPHGIASGLALY
jgi:hypothetical protein